jgi:hypothetical protein
LPKKKPINLRPEMKRLKEGTASIIPLSVDFVNVLPSGQTLGVTSSVTITDSLGVDTTSAMLSSSSLDSTKMLAIIKAGSVGGHYNVLFTAITASYKFLKNVELEVVDVA